MSRRVELGGRLGTYVGNLGGRDGGQSLDRLSGLRDLATLEEKRTDKLDTGWAVLGDKLLKAGLGDGGCELFLCHLSGGNGLDSLDGLASSGGDIGSGAGDRNSEQPSIRVCQVLGRDAGSRELGGGLAKERESVGPLDVGLAADQSREHLQFWLSSSEASTGEGQNNGVAAIMLNALQGVRADIRSRR